MTLTPAEIEEKIKNKAGGALTTQQEKDIAVALAQTDPNIIIVTSAGIRGFSPKPIPFSNKVVMDNMAGGRVTIERSQVVGFGTFRPPKPPEPEITGEAPPEERKVIERQVPLSGEPPPRVTVGAERVKIIKSGKPSFIDTVLGTTGKVIKEGKEFLSREFQPPKDIERFEISPPRMQTAEAAPAEQERAAMEFAGFKTEKEPKRFISKKMPEPEGEEIFTSGQAELFLQSKGLPKELGVPAAFFRAGITGFGEVVADVAGFPKRFLESPTGFAKDVLVGTAAFPIVAGRRILREPVTGFGKLGGELAAFEVGGRAISRTFPLGEITKRQVATRGFEIGQLEKTRIARREAGITELQIRRFEEPEKITSKFEENILIPELLERRGLTLRGARREFKDISGFGGKEEALEAVKIRIKPKIIKKPMEPFDISMPVTFRGEKTIQEKLQFDLKALRELKETTKLFPEPPATGKPPKIIKTALPKEKRTPFQKTFGIKTPRFNDIVAGGDLAAILKPKKPKPIRKKPVFYPTEKIFRITKKTKPRKVKIIAKREFPEAILSFGQFIKPPKPLPPRPIEKEFALLRREIKRREKSKRRKKTGVFDISMPKTASLPKVAPKSKPKIRQKLRQKIKLIPKLKPLAIPRIMPKARAGGRAKPPPHLLFPFRADFPAKRISFRPLKLPRPSRQPLGFQPSLVGLFFRKPVKRVPKRFTGLEVRPPKKRKKRRRGGLMNLTI